MHPKLKTRNMTSCLKVETRQTFTSTYFKNALKIRSYKLKVPVLAMKMHVRIEVEQGALQSA